MKSQKFDASCLKFSDSSACYNNHDYCCLVSLSLYCSCCHKLSGLCFTEIGSSARDCNQTVSPNCTLMFVACVADFAAMFNDGAAEQVALGSSLTAFGCTVRGPEYSFVRHIEAITCGALTIVCHSGAEKYDLSDRRNFGRMVDLIGLRFDGYFKHF
jgi:hypothetical protein